MQSPLLTCPRYRPEHPHLTAQPQGLTLCVLDNAANNHVGAWHFIIWFPHTSIFPYLRLHFRNHKALSTTQRQDNLRLSGQLHKVSLLNPKLLLSVRQFTGRKLNCFFQVISHCKYWDGWNCSVTLELLRDNQQSSVLDLAGSPVNNQDKKEKCPTERSYIPRLNTAVLRAL